MNEPSGACSKGFPRDRIAELAAGGSTGSEDQETWLHIEQCDDCAAEYADYRLLARLEGAPRLTAETDVAATPHLGGRILSLRQRWAWVAGAAAVTGAVVFGLRLMHPHSSQLTLVATIDVEVVLDGDQVCRTPSAVFHADPGFHRVEVRDADFEAIEDSVLLGPSEPSVLSIRAKDPAARSALARLAHAQRINLPGLPLSTARSPGQGPRGGVVTPRGPLLDAPRAVTVWSEVPILSAEVTLRDLSAQHPPLAEWGTAISTELVDLSLPEKARTALRPGVDYTVEFAPEGSAPETSSFTILAQEPAAAHLAKLEDIGRGFGRDEPLVRLARGYYLLAAGLNAEAYAEAVAVEAKVGNRRTVTELALRALDASGLRGTSPWTEAFNRNAGSRE